MTVAELAERLGACRSGRGWTARCPAHEDRSPSLSVAEGANGRLLLHCFAGCSTESIVSKLRLSMSDLFAEPSAARKPKPPEFQAAEKQAGDLRPWLTPRERVLPVTIVLGAPESFDATIARALALAVEGELVQVALRGKDCAGAN